MTTIFDCPDYTTMPEVDFLEAMEEDFTSTETMNGELMMEAWKRLQILSSEVDKLRDRLSVQIEAVDS